MIGINRRTTLTLLAGSALLPALPRAALAAYPDRPVHFVVPFPPGGAVDIVARTISEQAGPRLGQTIVIENRPGASGNIAYGFVAKAEPDGYNVLIGSNNLATNAALFGNNLSFNSETDLAPVTMIGYSPLMLLVAPDFKAKTVKELVDMAKADPGSLTFGSAGTGTSGHLATEIFKQVTGIQALHVPYKGGAPAMIDVMTGRVSFIFIDPVQGMPQIRGDKLRAIAVSSAERLSLLPDVPTVAEAGFPGVEAVVWWGFFVPAKTRPDIIARLNKDLDAALKEQKVKDTFHDMGAVLKGGSPDDFRNFLKSETEKWSKIIRTANIKAE
jgi:tripartite-type tricarboxylate transporter receptor subunit TctC